MKADLDESCASTPPSAIALMVIIEFSASRALTPSLSPKIQSGCLPPLHHQHPSLSLFHYTPPLLHAQLLSPRRETDINAGISFSFSSSSVSSLPPFENDFLEPPHLLPGFFFLPRREYTHLPFKKNPRKENIDTPDF